MQDEIVTAEDEAAEEAAFEAGFGGGDVPEGTETTQEQAQDRQPEAETEPKQETIEQAPRQITEEDVRVAVEAAVSGVRSDFKVVHDKVFGMYGALNHQMDALRRSAMVANPKQVERLKSEFPELADVLFSGEYAPEPVQQEPQPVQQTVNVDEIVASKLDAANKQMERRLLARDHSDWEQVVVSPDFHGWVATLPADEQRQLNDTWDADFVSGKLTEYKQHLSETAKKATESKEAKKRRVEAAIMPRGVVSGPPADEDDEEVAMLKAFKPR